MPVPILALPCLLPCLGPPVDHLRKPQTSYPSWAHTASPCRSVRAAPSGLCKCLSVVSAPRSSAVRGLSPYSRHLPYRTIWPPYHAQAASAWRIRPEATDLSSPWSLTHLSVCAFTTMPVEHAPRPSPPALPLRALRWTSFHLLLLLHLSWLYLTVLLAVTGLLTLRLLVAPIPRYLPMVLSWATRSSVSAARSTQRLALSLRRKPPPPP